MKLNEDEKREVDVLVALQSSAFQRYSSRQAFTWKITIAFWTALALYLGVLVREGSDFPKVAPPLCALIIVDWDFSLTDYIADWHRTLSRQNPAWWRICKPWPNKRYQHLSSVEVDESTGEWRETNPSRDEPEA